MDTVIVAFLTLFFAASSVSSQGYFPKEGSVRKFYSYYRELKIFRGEEWGSLCASSSWGWANARVICRMLGEDYGFPRTYRNTLNRTGFLLWTNCSGEERNIEDCVRSKWGKYPCKYVADVACWGEYSGNACGGKVCDNIYTDCCYDPYYPYCCNLTRTTTALAFTSSFVTTATVRSNPEDGFPVFSWWWIALSVIGLIFLVIIFSRLIGCWRGRSRNRNPSSGRASSAIRVTSDETYAEIRISQHISHTHSVNRQCGLPADRPPSYSDILRSDTESAFQAANKQFSELPPPPYTPPHSD